MVLPVIIGDIVPVQANGAKRSKLELTAHLLLYRRKHCKTVYV